jgi:NAD(P)-dependent dehydrogenase (short-subunit alcohol dehydrogenase family)
LQDKVAIVTGAGSIGPGWGNGKASAVLFAREGAKAFAVDLRRTAAEETKRIIDREGCLSTVHQADVTKSGKVKAFVGAAGVPKPTTLIRGF